MRARQEKRPSQNCQRRGISPQHMEGMIQRKIRVRVRSTVSGLQPLEV